MIEKIDNNKITDITKEASKQPQPAASDNLQQDASLQITYQSIIQQPQELANQDFNAVEEARRLISSGQLDTPENIRAAAKAIIKFGI